MRKLYWKITRYIYKKNPKLFEFLKKIVGDDNRKRTRGYLYSKRNKPYRLVEVTQKAHNGPILSVIIPHFNDHKHLDRSVQSALSQTVANIEILIVDDGSTDKEAVKYLKKYKVPKTKIFFIENTRVAGARNYGIRKAKGRYICCLDSDDYLEPSYFEKAISIMEANPSISFVYPDAKLFGDVEGRWKVQDFRLNDILGYNHVTQMAVYKRDMWVDTGGYGEDMKEGYEDWDFWIRAGLRGYRGKAINEQLFNYRKHGLTRDEVANNEHQRKLIGRLRKKYWRLMIPFYPYSIARKHYTDSKTKELFVNYPNYGIKKDNNEKLFLVKDPKNSYSEICKDIKGGKEKTTIIFTDGITDEMFDKYYSLTPFLYNIVEYFTKESIKEFIDTYQKEHLIKSVIKYDNEA